MFEKLDNLNKVLSEILDPRMDSVMGSLASSDSADDSGFTMLPYDKTDRLTTKDVSRLVALSSNKYAIAVRLASMARAKAKIAEANYKYKFRTNLGNGRNAEERESKAMAAAEEEYQDMILAQAILELCESLESANRVASESARRMMIAADQMWKAEGRISSNESSLENRDFGATY